LFGQRERAHTGLSDEETNINFLTGNEYSKKYYELLETRKMLPAWQAKKEIIKLIKEH
jgi:pre-mRNA-splicing factor ATP-dependent RNA helicase DHX15/PRP43